MPVLEWRTRLRIMRVGAGISLCRRGKHDRPTFSLSSSGNPVRPHDRGDRRCGPAGWFTSHTSRPPACHLHFV